MGLIEHKIEDYSYNLYHVKLFGKAGCTLKKTDSFSFEAWGMQRCFHKH